MKEIIHSLQQNLGEIFPEIITMEITPDTILEEIPDWDSMAAINLQVLLNQHYNLNLEQNALSDETSFREIIEMIGETVS